MKVKNKTAQSARILLHLKSGKSITALEALNLYGCFRLAARISDLRKLGHKIKSDRCTNQFGKTFAKYSLIVD